MRHRIAKHVEVDHDIFKKLSSNTKSWKKIKSEKIRYLCDPNLNITKAPFIDNQLLAAVLMAYNNHINLRMRPDDLWLVIAQGISQYIENNAEDLCLKFMNHQGKEEIHVESESLETCIDLIKQALKRKVKSNFVEIMGCDFTTSDDYSFAASTICIMSSMKHYFQYKVTLECGIPEIILDGTYEDWIRLMQKVDRIIAFNLEIKKWLKEVRKILANFLDLYIGIVDEKFWSQIINTNVSWGSGGDTHGNISGWITKAIK